MKCAPIPNALLDFWQADDRGAYDNTTFKMRGHQRRDRYLDRECEVELGPLVGNRYTAEFDFVVES